MIPFSTKNTNAYGNGTRPAGFLLGSVEDVSRATDLARNFGCDFQAIGCCLADGVTEEEAICALRNAHLLDFGDKRKTVAEAVESDESEPETEAATQAVSETDAQAWQSIEIATVEAIHADVEALLSAENIRTFGNLFDYGAKHEGFESIKGIGKATNKMLKAVLVEAMSTN